MKMNNKKLQIIGGADLLLAFWMALIVLNIFITTKIEISILIPGMIE